MPRGTTRRRFLAAAGTATAVGLAGCGGGGSGLAGPNKLTMHYGSMNERMAKELAALFNANGAKTALKKGGSNVENLKTVNEKEGAMAMVPADLTFFGKEGAGVSAIEKPTQKVTAVLPLYPLPLTVVARGDLDATKIDDLDGKRINVGQAGTALNTNAVQLVNPLDIDITQANLPLPKALDRIASGDLDATVARGDWPIPELVTAAKETDLSLLSLTSEVSRTAVQNEWLVKQPPYGSIPAGVYPGIDYAVETLSMMTILAVNKDAPRKLVRLAADAIFTERSKIRTHNTYLPEKRKQGGSTAYLNAELGVPINFHEGSAAIVQ